MFYEKIAAGISNFYILRARSGKGCGTEWCGHTERIVAAGPLFWLALIPAHLAVRLGIVS
jgi:hypothetical protein